MLFKCLRLYLVQHVLCGSQVIFAREKFHAGFLKIEVSLPYMPITNINNENAPKMCNINYYGFKDVLKH